MHGIIILYVEYDTEKLPPLVKLAFYTSIFFAHARHFNRTASLALLVGIVEVCQGMPRYAKVSVH